MLNVLRSTSTDDVRERYWRACFTAKRRADFYQDMINAIGAGITPTTAISKMYELTSQRSSQRWLSRILGPMIQSVQSGRSFSRAVSDWVPSDEAALLAGGERRDNLHLALSELVIMMKERQMIREALLENLLPVAGFMLALIGLMTFILQMIGGQAKEMMPPEVLAGLSVLPNYIALGEFVMRFGPPAVAVFVAGSAAIWWSLSNWEPTDLRKKLDRFVPPYSVVARIRSALFLVSMSCMLRSGQTFREAVAQIRSFSGAWAYGYMDEIQAMLRSGRSEVQALQVEMLSDDVIDRINFYALLPDFTQVMQQVARESLVGLRKRVALFGFIGKVVAMVALAGFILFTLASVYDMTEGMKKAAQMMS